MTEPPLHGALSESPGQLRSKLPSGGNGLLSAQSQILEDWVSGSGCGSWIRPEMGIRPRSRLPISADSGEKSSQSIPVTNPAPWAVFAMSPRSGVKPRKNQMIIIVTVERMQKQTGSRIRVCRVSKYSPTFHRPHRTSPQKSDR